MPEAQTRLSCPSWCDREERNDHDPAGLHIMHVGDAGRHHVGLMDDDALEDGPWVHVYSIASDVMDDIGVTETLREAPHLAALLEQLGHGELAALVHKAVVTACTDSGASAS